MSREFVPRPYQVLMIEHMLSTPRCAVWAGMGMGKSSSTLAVISELLITDGGPVLVLAPLKVAQITWPDEVAKWRQFSHIKIQPVVGAEQARKTALRTPADVYTINYDNLVWLVEYLGDSWPFKTVIADEATRLKSFRLRQGGRRAQALGKVAHTKIQRFIELTGTPAPNGLVDLWGQMWFIDIGKRLGRTFSAFKDRWFTTGYDGFSISPTQSAQSDIKDRLKDVCLTIKAEDWFDIKVSITTTVYAELPPKARKLYRDMEKDFFMQLEQHGVEAFNAAAKSQKLLQIASGAVYVDDPEGHTGAREWQELHTAKFDALDSILAEAGGAPVIVAYHFKSDLARLLKKYPKAKHLDGNPNTVKEWNAGGIPLLLAHPQSAGHGLNLQDGGNILVFFSHSWSLEDRLQIMERIGPVRQMQSGYNRPVFIYNIVARDTLDEGVLERVESKREVQDILLDAMRRRGGKH